MGGWFCFQADYGFSGRPRKPNVLSEDSTHLPLPFCPCLALLALLSLPCCHCLAGIICKNALTKNLPSPQGEGRFGSIRRFYFFLDLTLLTGLETMLNFSLFLTIIIFTNAIIVKIPKIANKSLKIIKIIIFHLLSAHKNIFPPLSLALPPFTLASLAFGKLGLLLANLACFWQTWQT
jgi:hypothetical protein